VFDDFGASVGVLATIQYAGSRSSSKSVCGGQPPLWTLAAGLVEFEHAIGLRPSEIQGHTPASDDGPQTIMHSGVVLASVEAQVQPSAHKVSRLRHTTTDAVGDQASHGVGGAHVIRFGVLEKCPHVSPSRKSNTECIGVL
jgi:hypothetical protein